MGKMFIYLFKLCIFGMIIISITHIYCMVRYKIVEWNSNETTEHSTSFLKVCIFWLYYMLINKSFL